MDFVFYCYISSPSKEDVKAFLLSLEELGLGLTRLGKSDPPKKFEGSINDTMTTIFSGTDLTNYTFARDSKNKINLSFQLRNDPRWTNSTVTASGTNEALLRSIARCSGNSFNVFISIMGVMGKGKNQAWEVLHDSESCPEDLRARITGAA